MEKLSNLLYSIFKSGRNYYLNLLNTNKFNELYFIFGMSYAVGTIFLGVKFHLIFRALLFVIFAGLLLYIYLYINKKFTQANKYLAMWGIAGTVNIFV